MITNNSQNLSCLRPKKFPLPAFSLFSPLLPSPPHPQLSIWSRHIKTCTARSSTCKHDHWQEEGNMANLTTALKACVTSLSSSHFTGQDKSHDYLTVEAETKSKNTATRSRKRFKLNAVEDMESQECTHQKRNWWVYPHWMWHYLILNILGMKDPTVLLLSLPNRKAIKKHVPECTQHIHLHKPRDTREISLLDHLIWGADQV